MTLCRDHSLKAHTLALALLAATGLASPALADEVRWIRPADGFWGDPSNWSGGALPGTTDTVRIGGGGLPAVTVRMTDMFLQEIAALHLSGGVTLDADRGLLRTDETLFSTLTGTGTTLRLVERDPGAPISIVDFSGPLDTGPGTSLVLVDGAQAWLKGASRSRGLITGIGQVNIDAITPFRNDGAIRPGNGGILHVVAGFAGEQRGRIDLDGQDGAGELDLSARGRTLRVLVDSLADDFGGEIHLGPESRLIFEATAPEGWTADGGSRVRVLAPGGPAGPSRIDSMRWFFGGSLEVEPAGVLRADSIVTLHDTARVELGAHAGLEFVGFTTIEGGAYNLDEDAHLSFRGPTTVEGGTFTTRSGSPANGAITFAGSTQYAGQVVIDGFARQDGFASTSGLGVRITARVFDIDGQAGSNQWTVGGPLLIEADRIEDAAGNIVSSDIEVAGGILPRLTIALTDPLSDWTMQGHLRLAGMSPLPARRLAGSPVRLAGTLEVTPGTAEVSADLRALPGSTIELHDDAVLRVRGTTVLSQGTTHAGRGTIRNGVDGRLVFDGAVDLRRQGVANDSTMVLGEGQAASVTMDRFEQTHSGVLVVSIGGDEPGLEHSEMTVTSDTFAPAGTLEVGLYGTDGPGTFGPLVGDRFRIINTEPGRILGAFDHVQETVHRGRIYRWDVVYGPDHVTLVLAAIRSESCPGDLDGDGAMTFYDTLEFLNLFEMGDPSADLDNNGSLDLFDILAFLNAMEQGCS